MSIDGEDSPVSQPPQKRTRSAVACTRCKGRRQKCDNGQPTCTNCAKANKPCIYTGSEYPSWYIKSLEDHIAKLESQLSAFESSHADDHLHRQVVDVSRPTSSSSATPIPSQGSNHLGNSLGFLSLLAAGEPYYLGMSGGYSLGHLVQGALYDQHRSTAPNLESSPTSPLDLPGPEQRPFSCHVPRTNQPPASLPEEKLGHMLLFAYLSTVHRSYPFMDRAKLVSAHLESQSDDATSLSQKDKMTRLKLHLVYGIGARHLQLSSSSNLDFPKDLPESHYVAAVSLLGEAFELRGMDNVEALLLLGLYSLHAPSGPGVWHLCGIALRLCVGMGLHRKVNGLPINMHRQDQLRKRLFWSCYMLERKMSNILGRPYSLGDHDINVELPDDWEPSPTALESGLDLPSSNIFQHIHLVSLERIISQIQLLNARITPSNPPGVAELNTLRENLNLWYQGTQLNKPSEILKLSYYKALRTLLYPFILLQVPDQSLVSECAKVSGQICQSYKRLHQGEDMGMFLLEVHDILVAGITLAYCAWLNPRVMNPYVVGSDLGACSTVLFIVSTRWKSAKKFRDAFEAITEKTMEHISNVTSSALSSIPNVSLVQEPSLDMVSNFPQASSTPFLNTDWTSHLPPAKVPIEAEHLDAFGQGHWVGEDDLWRMISDMTGVQNTNNMGMAMAGDFSWINDPSTGFVDEQLGGSLPIPAFNMLQ